MLLGDAGVGKSVMAGALAQRMRNAGHLGAAYFCRHNDGTRNDPRHLLGTIACQLCFCNSEYNNLVGGEDGVRMMLANSKLGVRELFTKLLEEPLAKCTPCQQRKLVIVDALDETEYESREDFLCLIKERFPRLPEWLVFFITSRPEDTIQSRLERYNPCVRICAGNSEQHNLYRQHELDIQRFLEKRLDFSRLPYSLEDVTNKCNGLFLYAYYIAKVLNDPVHPGKIDQLNDILPGDIGDFFRENFERLYDKVGENIFKKLFGCAIVAPSPLPVSIVEYILERENSSYDEELVIDAVSQFLVFRSSDQTIDFLHNLIPAWLTNKKKASRKLFIDKKTAGEYLRNVITEILPAVVKKAPPTLPPIDVDLQVYVSHVAVRFLCQHDGVESLKLISNCLTSYQFLEKRIQRGRIEVYRLLEDLQIAAGLPSFEDRRKQNVLQEISFALESNVHVLLECPQLFHSCLANASNAVQENVLIPQVSGPRLEWNVSDLPNNEFLSGFNFYATASNKKTVAGAKGRSLLFVDASTLKILNGPFEISEDTIEDISHLEFSPDDKYVFFGRLDKWFSIERGCVEALSQFTENSVIYEWGLFTPDERYIVVKTKDVFDCPKTCQDKRCVGDLLVLWAVKEIDQSQDDEMTCFFTQLSKAITRMITSLEGETKRFLESLQTKPTFFQTCVRSVPYDTSCYYCSRLEELTGKTQESSLSVVRDFIIELYPHIFHFQVWDTLTGRPLLLDVFSSESQLNSFSYFCHLAGAFDKWGIEVGCSGMDKAVSVCNIAVVNAVYALWNLELMRSVNEARDHVDSGIKSLTRRLGELKRKRDLKQEKDLRDKILQEKELDLKEKEVFELLLMIRESGDFEQLEKLRRILFLHLGRSWEFKPPYALTEWLEEELWLKKKLQEKRWRLPAPTRLFCDSFKSDICRDFPKGLQNLFSRDVYLCVSPQNKWVVEERSSDIRAIHLLQTGRQQPEQKLQHGISYIAHPSCFTFTNDELYVVYSSVDDSLHALSLETGAVLKSVSRCNLFYFSTERQVGYLFRSGTEERSIFLTNLFNPLKFFPLPPVKTSLCNLVAAGFISNDTVMSVGSDSTVVLWNVTQENKGSTFEFISDSSLTSASSQVLHPKNSALSPDGKLIAFHQETKIKLHSLEEPRAFHDTVTELESGILDVCLAFSTDSTLLLIFIRDGISKQHFYVWNVQKRAITASFKSPGLLTVEFCCLSPDKRNVILCGEYEIEIWEYDKQPCHLLKRIEVKELYKFVQFSHCAVSLNNEVLVCCIANEIILFSPCVPDVHSSKRILRGHLGRIEFCKFLKMNRYLISYGVDGMVFLWDVVKTKAVGFVRVAQGQENIVSLAVSPEEERIVCFTSSGRVCFIKLCKLEGDVPVGVRSKFVTSQVKAQEEANETRPQLAPAGETVSKSAEDEELSSSNSEEDMYNYYLGPEDLTESD